VSAIEYINIDANDKHKTRDYCGKYIPHTTALWCGIYWLIIPNKKWRIIKAFISADKFAKTHLEMTQ
jgi:hypothetical protein